MGLGRHFQRIAARCDGLQHVPVLDDPAVLQTVDVRDSRAAGSGLALPEQVHQREVAVDQHMLHVEAGTGRREHRRERLDGGERAIGQAGIMLDIIGRDVRGESARHVAVTVKALDEIAHYGAIVERVGGERRGEGDQRHAGPSPWRLQSVPSFISVTAWSQARAVSAI